MSQKSVKKLFPFKLGCTSYVYPDDILPNVRKMRDVVDDIEIVLFESEAISNLPDKDVIKRLGRISKEHEISYTIHFPIDLKAGSDDLNERNRYSDQVKKIVKLTDPLKPYGYIMHFEGVEPSASDKKIANWQKACDELCQKIALIPQFDLRKVCIENLDYPIHWHIGLIKKYGFSQCLDMGHLWKNDPAWEDTLQNYLHQVRIIHLHGVSEGRDHISLKYNKLEDLQLFFYLLKEKKYKNIVSLELFDEKDTFESIEIVRQQCQK